MFKFIIIVDKPGYQFYVWCRIGSESPIVPTCNMKKDIGSQDLSQSEIFV